MNLSLSEYSYHAINNLVGTFENHWEVECLKKFQILWIGLKLCKLLLVFYSIRWATPWWEERNVCGFRNIFLRKLKCCLVCHKSRTVAFYFSAFINDFNIVINESVLLKKNRVKKSENDYYIQTIWLVNFKYIVR